MNLTKLWQKLLPATYLLYSFHSWGLSNCDSITVQVSTFNGTACFEKYKQLLGYQNFLLLSDIWWLKLKYIFNCCLFFHTSVFRYPRQPETAVFLHRRLLCSVLLPILFSKIYLLKESFWFFSLVEATDQTSGQFRALKYS